MRILISLSKVFFTSFTDIKMNNFITIYTFSSKHLYKCFFDIRKNSNIRQVIILKGYTIIHNGSRDNNTLSRRLVFHDLIYCFLCFFNLLIVSIQENNITVFNFGITPQCFL